MKDLTIKDIDIKYQKTVYNQNYSRKEFIEGVKLVQLKNIPGEEGDLSEIVYLERGRIKEITDFEVNQINRTRLLPRFY